MTSNSKAATLFNLKDEYLKAKSDTQKSAAQGPSNHKKLKDIIHYKKAEKEKRLEERNAKQRKRAQRLALSEKEEKDLANSRSILEAKSAVYDKLLHREGDVSENILVDFTQKRIDGHKIPFDYNARPSKAEQRPSIDGGESDPEYDEIHLSHVDKGEVRSKGVGFYSFSKDPETRKQQMDFLNSMRESTERSREIFLASKQKRKKEKLDRLNRLRKKLEMAPLEVLPNEKQEEITTETDEPNNESTPNPDIAKNPQNSNVDIGKSIEEKFLIREQTLWERKVEELRNEREMEFAPVYGTGGGSGAPVYGTGGRSGAPVYGTGAGRGAAVQEEDELGEEDDAIVNFISFVRRTT